VVAGHLVASVSSRAFGRERLVAVHLVAGHLDAWSFGYMVI
jgi:hypothetical protein